MTKQEIIDKWEREIESLNIRIKDFGKYHNVSYRLNIKKQVISKILTDLKK